MTFKMTPCKFCVILLCAIATSQAAIHNIQISEYSKKTDFHRIIQRWPAEPKQFPHQASLRIVKNDGTVMICGGSLISRNYVLTAAHCLKNGTYVFVRLGNINITTPDIILESINFLIHPLYNPNNINNDIGLVNLGRNIQETDSIKIIRLPRLSEMGESFSGIIATLSGFGSTQNPGSTTETLTYVNLTIITNQRCVQDYIPQFIIESTICAAPIQSLLQTSCQGDSGGALFMTESDGIRTQIGIISFASSFGCSAGRASAYLRPHFYWQWLSSITGIPIRN